MIFVRRYWSYLLLALTFAVLSVYFYKNTIALPPSHIHAWTQSDHYAIALQFAGKSLNLFKPRTFNLSTREGVTAMDLPLHNYAVALVMKALDSRAPVIFRVCTLLICCAGYFFLFRLTRLLGGSALKAWTAAVFVFTCPIITYYQAGFIPSSSAFAAILTGYFFFFQYLKNNDLRAFYCSIAAFAAAALLRSPFNIFLFAVMLQRGLFYLREKKFIRREGYAFVCAYAAIIGYQVYKGYLARAYGNMFLSRLTPADDWAGFVALQPPIFARWSLQFFSVFHYLILGVAAAFLVVNLLKNKPISPLLKQVLLQSGLAFAGAGVYFVLMAKQYVDHEYYFIDSFYTSAILLLAAGLCCIPTHTRAGTIVTGVLFPALLAGGIYQSGQVQQEKYAQTTWDRGEVTRKNFQGAAALLDSLGIPPTAKVLVVDAYSTNAPLIALNRMGYTLMTTKRRELEKALRLPFDCVVVQDLYFPSDVVSPYPEITGQLERVGGNGKISVLRRSDGKKSTLESILGLPDAVYKSILNFDKTPPPPFWNMPNQSAGWSVSPPNGGFLTRETAFGPGFAMPTDSLRAPVSRLLFEGYFLNPDTTGAGGKRAYLVASIERGDQKFYYETYPLDIDAAENRKHYHALFFLPTDQPPGAVLKCYLWNPGGAALWMDDLGVRLF